MKELWDFNRSSVKSYLFFLIYFFEWLSQLFLKTPEINQLETDTGTFLCSPVRNKELFSHFFVLEN